MRAKDRARTRSVDPPAGARGVDRPASARPLLLVDIDGVISLFARERSSAAFAGGAAAGSLHSIDGILHYLSATAAHHLLSLARLFDLVWASGWEEKADEYLPHLLGLPAGLPFLSFARPPQRSSAAGASLDAHWKLEAVAAYAQDRPLAWIDDAFNAACHEWAAARAAPTLLVTTAPERGLTEPEARVLEAWAGAL